MKTISRRLDDFNRDRLPDMIRYKYEYMRENLFRFYRGSCHIFYEDLVTSNNLNKAPVAWITGDLHLENFGSYRGSNGLVYFDLNDFDEAILAPVTWEIARLATSILVAFDSLTIDNQKAMHMCRLLIRSYACTLANGRPDYIESNTATGIICDFLKAVGKRSPKAMLEKRTVKNKKMSLEHPRHLRLGKQLKKDLIKHVDEWLKQDRNSPYNYTVTDAVFRLAGTSSMGLKRYALLLKSSNKTGSKYLLLDMKQSVVSALQPFSKAPAPKWENPAARILFAQQLMQNRSPALLSSTVFKGDSYVVQEMQPAKDSIDFKLLKKRYRDMCLVIDNMGMLTASAQLRSSGRKGSAIADELVAFGQQTGWQEEVLDYAIQYAEKVKAYFAEFGATQ